VISHDRYFLDNIVDRIVELKDGETTEYLGNYTYYVEEKARRARGETPSFVTEEEDEEEAEYERKIKKKKK
jgi:ATPase subunit of ABC transporter with duplicated ATPase domains